LADCPKRAKCPAGADPLELYLSNHCVRLTEEKARAWRIEPTTADEPEEAAKRYPAFSSRTRFVCSKKRGDA